MRRLIWILNYQSHRPEDDSNLWVGSIPGTNPFSPCRCVPTSVDPLTNVSKTEGCEGIWKTWSSIPGGLRIVLDRGMIVGVIF